MGIYLNSSSAFGLFRRDCLSTYFIDKSSILKQNRAVNRVRQTVTVINGTQRTSTKFKAVSQVT